MLCRSFLCFPMHAWHVELPQRVKTNERKGLAIAHQADSTLCMYLIHCIICIDTTERKMFVLKAPRQSRLAVKSIKLRLAHSGPVKFAGLDRESFHLLATHYTPLMRDFFKPKVSSLEADHLTLSLPFRPEFVGNTIVPCLHGGTIAAMFDHTAGFCAWSALESSRDTVSTIDLRIDYLQPAPCEEIYFDAQVVSKSKKLIRVDAVCWDNARTKKIAIARGLFNVYHSKFDITALIEEYKKSV